MNQIKSAVLNSVTIKLNYPVKQKIDKREQSFALLYAELLAACSKRSISLIKS